MTPLERLRKNLAQDVEPPTLRLVLTEDLALALAVIDKAFCTGETYGDDMDRALEELWAALEPLTTESTNDGK